MGRMNGNRKYFWANVEDRVPICLGITCQGIALALLTLNIVIWALHGETDDIESAIPMYCYMAATIACFLQLRENSNEREEQEKEGSESGQNDC